MRPDVSRIVVLGSAGTGKTVFARLLGERTGLPVVSLDALWNRPLRIEELSAFRELAKAAHAGDRWISDGNFARATFDFRLPRTELVIWLECSRALSVWRVVRRAFRGGEPHRLRDLPEVMRFIFRFNRVNRPLIESERLAHAPRVPVVHLHGRRAMEAFIDSLVA